MKLVIVEWIDSSAIYGWHSLSDNDSIAECVSVGLVVRENEKEIVIAIAKSKSSNVDTTQAIPKVAITRIRKLAVKRIRQLKV